MTSFNLSTWAVRHGALVGFFAVVLCLAGLDSFLKLGRSEDPSYAIKVVNVVSLWPGASAQQMRDQVADPIEEKLQTIPYFDRIDTYATPGYLAMQVWVKDYTPPAEVPESFYQLRKKLQDMAGTLPDGVQGPFVDDEFGDIDSVLLAIKGEGASPHDLERIADQLQIALLRHSEISRVRTYGKQPRQVLVEYDDARMGTLGVPPGAITAALADFTRLHDAGTLDDGAQRLRISFAGDEGLARAIGAVSIPVGQSVLRLDDLARVSIGYPSPPAQMVRHDGQDAVILGVVMAPRENLSRIDAIVTETLAEARLPQGIEVTRVADQPAVAAHAIREFLTAFVEALAIVLAVCLVVLGWRTGIIVALSVPIVLAATFIVMRAMGIELHRVSLGALIIALGLLVDDAIIAIESMVRGIEAGKSRHEAVSMAWNSTAFPMLTGTLVTFIGFMPVGFAPSSTGEYLASLSWVIAIALIASWLVAVMLTPWLGVHLLPSQGRRHPPRIRRWQEALNATLGRTVGWAVDHYGRVITTIAVLFVLAGLGFVTVQKQFFPLSERVDLFVQLRLPQGSSIAQTSAAATEVEQFLAADPDATSVTTYIGQGPPRFWLALNPALPNPSYAELVVLGRDIAARERLKARLEAALSQGLAGAARARVIRFSFGPPVAYQVEFRISGAKPEELRRIGNDVRRIMAQDPRMTDPHLNWNERSPTLQLSLEPDRMRLFGLTFADVAARLQTAVGGARAGVLRDRDESLDVIVRAAGAAQSDPALLPDTIVANIDGRPVPLSQVARVGIVGEEPIIWQRSREQTLTVAADVVDGVQGPDVGAAVWRQLEAVRAALPPGYRMEQGGAWEESMKANLAIAKVFPGVLLLLLTVIMIQVQSVSRLGLILISAPLGMIGASLVLNLTHTPFGFVALLGLLALSGMDIRNSVILVDQVEANLRRHMPLRKAIVEATLLRARPVALTSTAAVLALIPLSRSVFWGPMALTIMGGLILATFMTILFLPALYALWFRRRLSEERPSPGAAEVCLDLDA